MKKRFWRILITLVMIIEMIPITASAADAITYIDCTWNGNSVVKTVKTAANYTLVTPDTATMSDGYYFVDGTVKSEANKIFVTGTVHLILADNSLLTKKSPSSDCKIVVNEGNILYIYAQSESDDMGAISLSVITPLAMTQACMKCTISKNGL